MCCTCFPDCRYVLGFILKLAFIGSVPPIYGPAVKVLSFFNNDTITPE